MRNDFRTDALRRFLALQAMTPLHFVKRVPTQASLESQTSYLKANPFSVGEFNKTLPFYLVPKLEEIEYKPTPPMTPKEVERETARLDALPKDEQFVIFCQAMELGVIEYLEERATYLGEIMNDIDLLELPHD